MRSVRDLDPVKVLTRRRFVLVLVALVALVALVGFGAACDGDDEPGDGGSPPPSGALGVVTLEAAEEAFRGLCDLQGATDVREANAAFFDRSHETLHVIAAATETVDRQRAAALLVAKQQVETGLRDQALPPTFAGDVEGLLGATSAALGALGLEAPSCAT